MDKRLQAVPELFPEPTRRAIGELLEERGDRVEELRFRAGCPAGWVTGGREYAFGGPELSAVTPTLLEEVVRRASGNAIYAVQEQLRQGYLTLRGGHRLGLCGTAALEDGCVKTIRSYQSLSLRLAGERTGCADQVARFVKNHPGSTLILGPPGVGKTTLLRDLVRRTSDWLGCRVGLVDERGELAACLHGLPQMNVGRHTDVLTGVPKATGILLLLRSMAPEWIAVDEITAPEDVAAMERAAYCGVRFFATAHAACFSDLESRPLYRRLLEAGVFDNAALIHLDRSISCERIRNELLQAGRSRVDSDGISLDGPSRGLASASAS